MKSNLQFNHKKANAFTATALAAAMTVSTLSPLPVKAAAENTPKEEVVYVNLNADGSVKEINVVNIFDLDSAGQIVDYGLYSELRNMTSTDAIEQSDDTITIDAQAGKLYYEGHLDSTVMPWNISIHYFMDDKEYTAEEIAGMCGTLRIEISITENTKCQADFFDRYALQASLTLDTKQCQNIFAEDATIANVGSDKQLTYTILPGDGADFVITADVTDFEMDAIAINGLPLNLSIDVDDTELLEQVADLQDALQELDDGAGELCDGADELHSGSSDLKDGADSLQTGVTQLQTGASDLDDGIQNLNEGIAQMQLALNTLNGQSSTLTEGSAAFKTALGQLQTALNDMAVTAADLSELRSASSSFKTGIGELTAGITTLQQNVSYNAYKQTMLQNGLDVDMLQQNNATAALELQTTLTGLNQQIAALQTSGADTSALETQAKQLENVIALLSANNANLEGTKSYLGAANESISTLLSGASTLNTNYAAFDEQIGKLVDSLGSITYQMSSLTTAVNTLVTEYDKIDGGITDYTKGIAQIVKSYTKLSKGSKQLVKGSRSLKSGTDELYTGTNELVSGILEMYDGTESLKDGTVELKDGTSTLREETADLDTEINDKIDEMLSSISGSDTEITSFVSEQNQNIKSVQFVIKTEAIQIDEPEETEEETETPSFWQKLVNLFHKSDE